MSTHTVECFLCGAVAERQVKDSPNRWFYLCSSSDCGDYDISRRAAQRIGESSSRKAEFAALAAAARKRGEVLKIYLDGDLLRAGFIALDNS